VGESTEAALRVLVEKIGNPCPQLTKSLPNLDAQRRTSAVSNKYETDLTRLLTFEFSRDRKMMSVLVRRNEGQGSLLVKGAPEAVLDRCGSIQVDDMVVPLVPSIRQAILSRMASYNQNGLRTLALAYADKSDLDVAHYASESTAEYGRFEQNLTFVSLVGMFDPPRPEVRDAVTQCKAAGIRIICITGDNQGTAEAICRQIGILEPDEDTRGKSYTGRQFDDLSRSEKVEVVKRAKVFSRTEPSHKLQLVELLQQSGLVVAMVSRRFCRRITAHTDLLDRRWRQRRPSLEKGGYWCCDGQWDRRRNSCFGFSVNRLEFCECIPLRLDNGHGG
jgi:Ca2+ transporting ATPase